MRAIPTLGWVGRRRDTRSTSPRPTGEQYVLNMTGYAVAYRHQTGEVETDTVLDYLVATKAPYYLPVASEGPVSDRLITRFANEERPARHLDGMRMWTQQ